MKDTRVYRSEDIGSDHYLVCSRIKLRLRKQPNKPRSVRVKYDTVKLKNEDNRRTYTITLRNRYQVLEDEGPEVAENEEAKRNCQMMEKAYTEAAEAVLGRARKRKPWISEES